MSEKQVFKNYYAIIPANVRYDKELTANAKLLYGEITALCNEKGYCWATNAYFAELYDVSIKSISKWISQLINKNYLQSYVKYKEGSKEIEERRLYIGGIPMEEKFHTYGTKVQGGIEEKFQDNNTYINNTINNSMYIYREDCQQENNLKEFSRLYEQNIGLINGVTSEYLKDLSETIDVSLFKRAIEIATDKGSCNLGYIKGIIRQWLSSNITTLEQLEAYKLQQNQNNKNTKGVTRDDTKGRTDVKSAKNVGEKENNMPTREEMLRQIRELDNE